MIKSGAETPGPLDILLELRLYRAGDRASRVASDGNIARFMFMWVGSGANADQLVTAVAPLPGVSIDPVGGLGPAFPFGKLLLSEIAPQDAVVVVPVGVGGTGFEANGSVAGRWKVEDVPGTTNLAKLWVQRAKAAIAAAKAAGWAVEVAAIGWQQGEADGNVAVSEATHAANLDALIAYFRAQVPEAKDAPFIAGLPIPERVADQAGIAGVVSALKKLPARVPLTAWAPSPAGYDIGDRTHLSATGTRILVRAYWDALGRARQNRLGVVPAAPTSVAVSVSVSGVTTVTWTAPRGRVTDYTVQVRGIDSADWTTLTRTANDLTPSATVSGAALGTVVEARVLALSEAGSSDWSPIARGAAVTAPAPAGSQASSTSVNVSWTPNPLASSYRVDRKLHSAPTWTTGAILPPSASSTTVTGLSAASWDLRLMTYTPYGVTSDQVTVDVTAGPISGVSAARAAGLRRVISGYTGPAVRVRRSSDNTETDIGLLTGGGLDLSALSTFCGAGDGYVSKLYDQSGNGRDWAQTTQAAQPRIYASGAVVTLTGGKPALEFDGSNDVMLSSWANLYSGGAATRFLVTQGLPAAGATIVAEASSSSANPFYALQSNRTDGRIDQSIRNDSGTQLTTPDSTGYTPQAFTTTIGQVAVVDTGANLAFRVNGTQVGSRNYTRTGTLTLTQSSLGALQRTTGAGFAAIKIAELFESGVALALGDVQTIEANQKAYYGTP